MGDFRVRGPDDLWGVFDPARPIKIKAEAAYAGVGALAALFAGSRAIAVYREYDRCEHLIIVADAAVDAFAFFDRVAR